MHIKENKIEKCFTGKGNIKINIISSKSPIKYKINDSDFIEIKKRSISISMKKSNSIFLLSENEFTVEIYHNGKKKR